MRRTQEDRSATTKSALVSAARELFAARGYAAVPADEIVRAAGVTRGALYHHYADKQGLFRAVFEEVERELTNEVAAAMAGAPDFGTGMLVALGAFLDACGRAEVRRISLTDAPAVLEDEALDLRFLGDRCPEAPGVLKKQVVKLRAHDLVGVVEGTGLAEVDGPRFPLPSPPQGDPVLLDESELFDLVTHAELLEQGEDAGNQRLAAVDRPVQIEEPAAMRQGEGRRHLANEGRDGGLGEIGEGRRHDAKEHEN